MLHCAGTGIRSCNVRPWRDPLAAFLLRFHSNHAHRGGVTQLCRAASESPYRILGVAPSASEADIKRAYRKLALRYHPDVNKAPDAQQRFMSIKTAYQTLIDSNSRSDHPTANRSTQDDPFPWGYSSSGGEAPNEFYDIGDAWEDLQSSFEEFLGDLQAGLNRKSAANKPKSLWEELAEVGEEFVEFLEKELNIVNDIKQVLKEDDDTIDFRSMKGAKSNSNNGMDAKEQARKLETEINEIEEMLAKLKQDLGL